MNALDRLRIRQARDALVRARISPEQRAIAGIGFCVRCGGLHEDWTPGCQTCWDRWYRWNKIGAVDPVLYQELKKISADYSRELRRQQVGDSKRGKPGHRPAKTWRESRANFGRDRVIPIRGTA